MTQNISNFLDIFKNALISDDSFKEDVSAVVLDKTKFPIEKKCVNCKNGILQIKTDPYTKTEINLHKEEILKIIQEKYPKKKIIDVR